MPYLPQTSLVGLPVMYSSIADIRLDLLTRETNCPPSLLLRISCSSRGSGASSSSSCIYPNTLPLASPDRIQIQITRHTPGIPGIRYPALALNHACHGPECSSGIGGDAFDMPG